MIKEISGEAVLKVLVVDDHPIFREGLADMLRDAGYIVFEAGGGERAVNMASSGQPQLVIMDVLMPGMSGIEAAERIIAQDPTVRVLMLSVADSAETVRAAMRAGAASYLTKASASRASLLDAVRRTLAGERVFSPAALLDALVNDPAQPSQSEAVRLTLREKEIITLAAQGTANSAIAAALGLSSRTVENHLARIYKKLGITSRTQLARVAIAQQMDRYPWAGQTCTIMLADIAAFSAPTRSDTDRAGLRVAIYEILREVFTRSGIPWSASHLEDRGDGVLIIVPPGVPTSALIDPCLTTLADSLRRHNSMTGTPVSMKLRVAVHVGPVAADALGVSGEAIIRAARLVEAPVFKDALRVSAADLGVIVSEFVYESVIRQGHLSLNPADLQSVDIRVKNMETPAWMWFSGYAPPSGYRSMKSSPEPQPTQARERGDASAAHSAKQTSTREATAGNNCMEDQEIVAAIVADDPAGLAEAYDRYAAQLYSFCRTMLREPADAADAVQDTFVLAAYKLGGLRDPRKLRNWLYAVARNECLRRLRSANTTVVLEHLDDLPADPVDPGDAIGQAQLRELVRDAIDGLNPAERDIIELSLGHALDSDDLATALEVSRNHAHALLSRARSQLERSLSALIVARTGRATCADLDAILVGWDGRMTVLMRKQISRHIARCEICSERERREFSPALFAEGLPLAATLPGFRRQVLKSS